MKHPIYRNKDIITLVNNIKNPLMKKGMSVGFEYVKVNGDASMTNVLLAMFVHEAIMKNGHTYINAKGDEWFSKISAKTLSQFKISEFKLPFKSAYIDLAGDDSIVYSEFMNSELLTKINNLGINLAMDIDDLWMSSEDVIIIMHGVQYIPLLTKLTIDENIAYIKSNTPDMEDARVTELYEKINIFLSVMLYIASYQNDDNRVSSRLVKGDKSASKGIKKHTVNVIKLYQHTANIGDTESGGAGWHSDKKWIVRGHWRSQYYKSTDENKPKWIDPYWKGDGKEEVEKIYSMK